MAQEDYLLGVNAKELERLEFQHSVWGTVTRSFLDRLGVAPGWKCLDAGAGPGLVTLDLAEIVGPRGEVTALEPSPFYLEHGSKAAGERGRSNIRFIQGSAEEAALPVEAYDLVFARWVLSFVPDLDRFFAPLLRALKPGGIIAIEDYYYEGLSLFPIGGAFDHMADVVRAHYRLAGGDPYVAGKLPGYFRNHGVSLKEFHPNCLAGGPESGIMEWAHRFFTVHTQAMVESGATSQKEADAMIRDWQAHRSNSDAMFFSPIVVDVAGRKA